jgi:c-di-AMP phosphodiesterase-like protein
VRKYVQPDLESFRKINDILTGMLLVKIASSEGGKQGIAFARCDISAEDANTVAPMAADKMLEIAGVDASFVLIQMEGGVSIKARSLGDVNVQIILENNEIKGGGHLTAAGGFAKGMTVEQVISILARIMEFDEKLLASLI